MKVESKEIINKINSGRIKVHYKLNELEGITGLCSRSLKYKMKSIKDKYADIPSLLIKSGREWKIHYTIIDEFMPIYKKQQTNIYNHGWQTMLTWNLKNNYDYSYHIELIEQVKTIIPSTNIAYVVEHDGRGYNHVHAIVDLEKKEVEQAVDEVLNRYLCKTDYRSQIEKINNKSSVTTYLQKSGRITII
jgi:hypothetical protein